MASRLFSSYSHSPRSFAWYLNVLFSFAPPSDRILPLLCTILCYAYRQPTQILVCSPIPFLERSCGSSTLTITTITATTLNHCQSNWQLFDSVLSLLFCFCFVYRICTISNCCWYGRQLIHPSVVAVFFFEYFIDNEMESEQRRRWVFRVLLLPSLS